MDSNDDKKEMLKYLIEAHKFQFFSGDTPRGLASKLEEDANGYCFELMGKDQKKNPAFLNFIQNIKDQHIQQGPGLEKYPSSSKVVIISDYMPNLNYYSLPRWVFFHTKLGLVHLKCEQEGRKYKCSISPAIANLVSDFKIKPCSTTDAELYEQYFQVYSGKLAILLTNELAFPKIVGHHKAIVQYMIEKQKYSELKDYIQKNFLKDSIARNINFIRGPSAPLVGVVRNRDPESRECGHSVEDNDAPPVSKVARRH